jgi:carbon-monoxide dehydrogenase medium subunit
MIQAVPPRLPVLHRRARLYLETVSQIHEPVTVGEAVALLDSLGEQAAPLAGATWVMREAARKSHYVSLRRLQTLRAIERGVDEVRVGALATHDEIGGIEPGTGPLGALAEAARRSAFPAVRSVATLGGNIAAPFPEADLLPALLAASATLELALPSGPVSIDIGAERPAGALIVAARVPAPPGRQAWFERVTVRRGAEYSIVSVAVSVDLEDATVAAARVAVGAVQDAPCRVPAAERQLEGRSLDRAAGEDAGRAAARSLNARDGLDAPAWYRLEVLPALVARAVTRLAQQWKGDR